MTFQIVELQTKGIALQWTGSNEVEFEELQTFLGLTGSVTVSSGQLTFAWDSDSWWTSGSLALTTDRWLVENPNSGSQRFSNISDVDFRRIWRQVYP